MARSSHKVVFSPLYCCGYTSIWSCTCIPIPPPFPNQNCSHLPADRSHFTRRSRPARMPSTAAWGRSTPDARPITSLTSLSRQPAVRRISAGSRVYVTVNIVIKDEEMSEALSLVDRCWRLGADAFIIQDWGLFLMIRRLMPEVETHISTQANIHDAGGYRLVQRSRCRSRHAFSRALHRRDCHHPRRRGYRARSVLPRRHLFFATRAFACFSSFTCRGARLIAACVRSPAACLTS